MITSQASAALLQRIDVALTSALRNDHDQLRLHAGGPNRENPDLFIKGVAERDLPISLGRTKRQAAHSGMALAINSFFPWRRSSHLLRLANHEGFDAIQFDVRCPTGLRGTPPHLDLLALRDDHAVAVIVRSIEYLTRKRSPITTSYDDLLETTAGMLPWHAHLADWRGGRVSYQHIDLPALIKYATALGQTFPDRTSTLLYLYWEPLDAEAYDVFRCHRNELDALTEAVAGARVDFAADSFNRLWQDWSERSSPTWLSNHVARLRRRYAVALESSDQ